jgi:cytochrome c oxidase subunit 3
LAIGGKIVFSNVVKKREDIEDRIARKAARNHPLKNLVYFVIAGITMLFATLMVLFGMNHPRAFFAEQHFPIAFYISTALIIVSSYFIEKVNTSFDKEDGKKMLDNLLITLALAVGFSVAQGFGWMALWESNITLYSIGETPHKAGTPNGAFLFIISGLHLLHLTVGLIFLFAMMFKVVNARSDDVRCVVYFSNRLEKARIEMLAKYWHFLGGLWVLLFIYFLCFFLG